MDSRDNDAGSTMTFHIASGDHAAPIVTISGELDISNASELESAVAPIIAQAPERLVVDVSQLQFADTSAIAVWVRWSAAGCDVELRGVSPLLRQVITRMGLSETLRVKDEEDA